MNQPDGGSAIDFVAAVHRDGILFDQDVVVEDLNEGGCVGGPGDGEDDDGDCESDDGFGVG